MKRAQDNNEIRTGGHREITSIETCEKKECKTYQVHQTKDLEALKIRGDIEVSTEDSDSL